MSKLFTRFIILSLMLALVACGGSAAPEEAAQDAGGGDQAPAPAAAAEDVAPPSEYTEAPMLAEMVAAGELPPLEERLPKDPFVVGPGVLISDANLPDWTPGKYGGTLRAAHAVADWAPDIFVMNVEQLISAPGLSVQNIRANIVKDFEVTDENKVFTFYMREGMKWSDGEPLTTEDVRFTYEDYLLNEKLNPTIPRRFRTGGAPDGTPMNLEIIDDYTFRISFDEPYGGFLRQLVIEGWVGYASYLIMPSHYLRQFHPNHTPMEELQPYMDELNLTDEWWQMFTNKNCVHWDLQKSKCVGFPVLNPWIIVDATPGVLILERNPYYFKVDTEGQQLPYIDKIVTVQAEDVEAVNLKVLTGDVDFLRESTGLVKMPLYKENEEQANFKVHLLDMHVDSSNLKINQTYDDPIWREVVQDIRFRQALSMAINRDELIESIYYTFASMPVNSVGEPYMNYDPEAAGALLDEMGMDLRGEDGFRLAPNGEPFEMLLEQGAQAPDIAPVAELVAEHLKDVGLNVQMKQIDSQLFGQRNTANELQASVMWSHDENGDDSHTGGAIADAGRLWRVWQDTDGAEGEEPPAWAIEAFELDRKRWGTVSGSDEYNQMKEQGLAWERENLPFITLVEQVKYPMIASADLRNIPQGGFAIGANFSGEQLYFDK